MLRFQCEIPFIHPELVSNIMKELSCIRVMILNTEQKFSQTPDVFSEGNALEVVVCLVGVILPQGEMS